jgi:hypothetical protein
MHLAINKAIKINTLKYGITAYSLPMKHLRYSTTLSKPANIPSISNLSL